MCASYTKSRTFLPSSSHEPIFTFCWTILSCWEWVDHGVLMSSCTISGIQSSSVWKWEQWSLLVVQSGRVRSGRSRIILVSTKKWGENKERPLSCQIKQACSEGGREAPRRSTCWAPVICPGWLWCGSINEVSVSPGSPCLEESCHFLCLGQEFVCLASLGQLIASPSLLYKRGF